MKKNYKNRKIMKKSKLIVLSLLTIPIFSLVSCHKTTHYPHVVKWQELSEADSPWTRFRQLAETNTATALKQTLTNDQLFDYKWHLDDIVAFQNPEAPFIIDNINWSVSAYLVIKGANANDPRPVYFIINYLNNVYNKHNWNSSSYIKKYNDNWTEFKAITQKLYPAQILTEARKHNKATSWADSDKATWDIYGSNGASDPYKGMQGNIKFDETHHSVSGVISIDGFKNGDAKPIAIEMTKQFNQKYQSSDWTFNDISQMQSRASFQAACQYAITNQYSNHFLKHHSFIKSTLIKSHQADPNRPFTIDKNLTASYSKWKNAWLVATYVDFFDIGTGTARSVPIHNLLMLTTKNGPIGPAYQDNGWEFD